MSQSVLKEPKGKRQGYRELSAELRRQIETGEYASGAQLPSFSDMRRQGFGQATVERAYALLEEEGIIRREPGRGVFANQKRRSSTGFIGFIGSNFAQRQYLAYSGQLVAGIESIVHREERRILLLKEDSPLGWDQVDGVLISAWNARAIARSLPSNLPHVSILLAPEGVPGVVADDYGGAKMGIEHLLALGHRRVACLLQHSVGPNWVELPYLTDGLAPGRLRLGGYIEALQSAGIEPNQTWIHDPGPPRHEGYRQWGYDAVTSWLQEDWKSLGCTALFVQNDLAAIGAVQAFQEAGVRVPQDVSVLSFDGTEACEHSSPTLASIEVPLSQIGAAAVELLLRQIREGKIEPNSQVVPTKFKPGNSIVPPPSH